ncbi:MAG: prepilin-type N-terminal cleavage/methylation domain-containing protein [Candidatus Paceibacterota bacterium]
MHSELLHHNKNDKGLSLIEVIIYLAIMAIFISATFLLVNQSLENAERVRIKIETAANLEIVLRKIEWAMSEAETVNFPVANTSSTQFSINRFSSDFNPIVFTLSGAQITLSKSGGPAIDLTNNKVRVTDFLAEHFSTAENPSTLRIKLSIKNKASGRLSEIASTTIQMFFVVE